MGWFVAVAIVVVVVATSTITASALTASDAVRRFPISDFFPQAVTPSCTVVRRAA
jgi:hypothetical protein